MNNASSLFKKSQEQKITDIHKKSDNIFDKSLGNPIKQKLKIIQNVSDIESSSAKLQKLEERDLNIIATLRLSSKRSIEDKQQEKIKKLKINFIQKEDKIKQNKNSQNNNILLDIQSKMVKTPKFLKIKTKSFYVLEKNKTKKQLFQSYKNQQKPNHIQNRRRNSSFLFNTKPNISLQYKKVKFTNCQIQNKEKDLSYKLQTQRISSKSKSLTKSIKFIPSFIKSRSQKNEQIKKSQILQNSFEKFKFKQDKKWSINDFQIKERLGKGAFGDVYLVRENSLGLFCVLKKLSKKKIKQLKLEEQILRQIKIQSFLNHPHLTNLYGFFDDQENVYLILEYLTDGSLAQRFNRKKCSEQKLAFYLKQICEGLKCLHIQQIIHRDLKPENIFIHQDYLKIGDFGCAIQSNLRRNTIVGCLAYISPEQLNKQSYDDKIDMWSLGVLCYELLVGKAPFEEEIIKITRKQKQSNHSFELKFPQNIEISLQAEDFIKNLLCLVPENRMSIIQALKKPFIIKNYQQLSQKFKNDDWIQQIRQIVLK